MFEESLDQCALALDEGQKSYHGEEIVRYFEDCPNQQKRLNEESIRIEDELLVIGDKG